MDSRRLAVLVIALVTLAFQDQVLAEFGFQRPLPKTLEEARDAGYKCIPGRTMIRVKAKEEPLKEEDSEEEDARRSHMNSGEKGDESCEICVCSVEGKDEYCSNRPARNVNECLRMSTIMDDFQKNLPYEHDRILAYRIRRDYIWHNGEIPYESKAKCFRAHSYYSNNPKANDTDIDKSNPDELLSYDTVNTTVCYYCVCSVSGRDVGCLERSPWFCEYFKNLRTPSVHEAIRDRYRILFQQDRPQYFSTLSWRMRRQMDDGIFELISTGGDALCCSHPSGHQRSLHNRISMVFRNLRRKVPKENLMNGSPAGDYVDFVVNNDK